jgi:hypothetical protein
MRQFEPPATRRYAAIYSEARQPEANPARIWPEYLRFLAPLGGSTWALDPLTPTAYRHAVVTQTQWDGKRVWVTYEEVWWGEEYTGTRAPKTARVDLERWMRGAVYVNPPKFVQRRPSCTCGYLVADPDCPRHAHEHCEHRSDLGRSICCICEFGRCHTQWTAHDMRLRRK